MAESGNPLDCERGERWVDIAGTYYHYQISTEARVRCERPDGSWRYLNGQTFRRGDYTSRKYRLVIGEKKYRLFTATRLMRDAFMGGPRPGKCVVHINRMTTDDRLENLRWGTHSEIGKKYAGNRRPVVKIDPSGEIVAAYGSIADACRKEYINPHAIRLRAAGRCKVDEFKLCGYSWRYER